MRFSFAYARLTDGKNQKHFLLETGQLEIKAWLADGRTVDIPVARTVGGNPAFGADLTPMLIPVRLTRVDLVYRIERKFDGKDFQLIEVRQRLVANAVAQNAVPTATYVMTPGGWEDGLGRMRIAGTATHPLVDLAALPAGRITLKIAMLDLTDAWSHLNRENRGFKNYSIRSSGGGVTFKVFAYLGGPPLIWYGIVPRQLSGAATVSPHVFFSPADNAIDQDAPDKAYLGRSAAEFRDKHSSLFRYLLAPIPDIDVRQLKQQLRFAELLRNVVTFEHVVQGARRTTRISPRHWRIGAGLEKAFRNIGEGKPRQILLLPQRMGSTGWAVTAHLKPATDAVVDLLQSSVPMLAGAGDILVNKDKMVLSCYSESGVDLWQASLSNQNHTKAIIAIEPQNMNMLENDYRRRDAQRQLIDPREPEAPLGKHVIPVLLGKKVAVFVIGRHHSPKYRPAVSNADLAKVRLLPKDPAAIFAYPPNPATNDFIKYRAHRIVDPASDPFLHSSEEEVIQALAARGITGAAALAAIFQAVNNKDKSDDPAVDQWYSHQFALSGGEEMQLDPGGIYDKPVTYRTFFEAAVHEVG